MAKKEEPPKKHQGFDRVNLGHYAVCKGQVSGTCQRGGHARCFSLSCACECHKDG